MKTYTFNGRRNEFGEYVIRCYISGKRFSEGDYHTNDLQDARATLKLLQLAQKEQP